ncbi:MAG: hypothetical protein GX556_10230 [Fibrobacter sp.]|nr:hypothetical protein [Fibrobacter sp.]
MRGVQYVTDEKGEKTAVLIDLKKNGDLWEDFYDYTVSRERENESRESLDSVRKRIIKNGKR